MPNVVSNENDIFYAPVENIDDEAQWIVTIKNIYFDFND